MQTKLVSLLTRINQLPEASESQGVLHQLLSDANDGMFFKKIVRIQAGLEKIEEYKVNFNQTNSTTSILNTDQMNDSSVIMKKVPYFSIFFDELCEFIRKETLQLRDQSNGSGN